MKSKLALLTLVTAVFGALSVLTGAVPEIARADTPEEVYVQTLSSAPTEVSAAPTVSEEPSAEPSPAPSPTPSPAPTPEPSPTPTPAPSPAPESAVAIAATTITSSSPIKNSSSLSVNPEELMAQELTQTLPAEGAQILIVHTHATEAYTPEEGAEYESSGDWRSTEAEHNVIRVGEALKEALEAQGLNVIHDTGLYDYPSYNGSYNRSAEAIARHLEENPGISLVIDLHRDALGTDELIYKTLAEGTAEPTAQLMFVLGTDENLEHPLWEENLKLALALQDAVQAEVPTLMRPINLCSYRYNQQLTTGSMILEVGTCGNTMAEALRAVELFAAAAGPVLLGLAE